MKIYITNLLKGISMYKKGMSISIFSIKKFQYENIRWFKGGNNINSSTTNFARPSK